MRKEKVLVVEDNEQWQGIFARRLAEEGFRPLQATSISEAERLFEENPDIVAVIMDACVPGDSPNTQPLVQKIRESFKGPMIAVSSASQYRKQLVEAGCSHECPKSDFRSSFPEVLAPLSKKR